MLKITLSNNNCFVLILLFYKLNLTFSSHPFLYRIANHSTVNKGRKSMISISPTDKPSYYDLYNTLGISYGQDS